MKNFKPAIIATLFLGSFLASPMPANAKDMEESSNSPATSPAHPPQEKAEESAKESAANKEKEAAPKPAPAHIYNFHVVNDKLVTAGVIQEGGLEEAVKNDVKVIIDLRTPPEGTKAEQEAVEKLQGVTYYNFPVSGMEGITKEQVEAFAKIYENTEEGVILLHCASGNRAGALWAAYQLSKDVPQETAIEEGRAAGMKPSMEEGVKHNFCKSC